MAEGESRILQLAPGDNVAVAIREIEAGETVVKYGTPVGRATADIAAGEPVHAHNLAEAGGAAIE